MTAQQKISGRILVLMTNYKESTGADDAASLKWAFDRVLGVGSYQKMVEEVYQELTAKAA
jgi:hypothetical protein